MQRIKTFLILALLTGLFLAVGRYLGGQQGLYLAFGLALVMNFVSYWWSDRIVLSMYKAQPIERSAAPELYDTVESLSREFQIPMPKVHIIDLPAPNAFATGRNPAHASIAVSRSLMEILNKDELRGVLAHELAHVKNRDILVSSVAAVIAGALSMLSDMFIWGGGLFGGRSDEGKGNPIGALVLVILTPLIAMMLQMAISRSREYLADETGGRISRDPEALASALLKIHDAAERRPLHTDMKHNATAHLFIANPFDGGMIRSLFSTHPPVEERVERLRSLNLV